MHMHVRKHAIQCSITHHYIIEISTTPKQNRNKTTPASTRLMPMLRDDAFPVRLCLPPVAPVHDGLPARFPAGDHRVIPVRVSGFPTPAGSWNHGLIPPHSLDFSLREGLREALFGKHI